MHVPHASEVEQGFAARAGDEGASAAWTAAVRRARGESRSFVDAQTAFVADPARVTGVLIQGILVASPRLETGDLGSATSWCVPGKTQMVSTSSL